jgi:hypothetical protein
MSGFRGIWLGKPEIKAQMSICFFALAFRSEGAKKFFSAIRPKCRIGAKIADTSIEPLMPSIYSNSFKFACKANIS